jgi:hypothetical protein
MPCQSREARGAQLGLSTKLGETYNTMVSDNQNFHIHIALIHDCASFRCVVRVSQLDLNPTTAFTTYLATEIIMPMSTQGFATPAS